MLAGKISNFFKVSLRETNMNNLESHSVIGGRDVKETCSLRRWIRNFLSSLCSCKLVFITFHQLSCLRLGNRFSISDFFPRQPSFLLSNASLKLSISRSSHGPVK